MLLIVGLASLWRESDRVAEGDADDPVPRSFPLVLGFAVLGACAWGVSRVAQWRIGQAAGPGVASILMLWMTAARISLDSRRRARSRSAGRP
jgi:hypothetical protein